MKFEGWSMKIQNSRILITGANRGIGLAFAKLAAQKGAALYILTRKPAPDLTELLLKLGAREVHAIICDLSNSQEFENTLKDLKKIEIDILFNNAGVLTGELLDQQSLTDIQNLLQINVYALIALTKTLLPQMLQRKHGKIINQASVAGIMHFPCSTTYSASKAAVIAFTQALDLELKKTGVTTLCLITPAIETDMLSYVHQKFGKHLKIPKTSMTPDQYAIKIGRAIETDQKKLLPFGLEWFGVIFATYTPALFRWVAKLLFNRNSFPNN